MTRFTTARAMTTAADVPYGTGALKSKYHGQDGPTPSQYWKNFER